MLQSNLATNDSLKQRGAVYRVIRPICSALDPKEVFDIMFS